MLITTEEQETTFSGSQRQGVISGKDLLLQQPANL
jgi:hypothetical protein